MKAKKLYGELKIERLEIPGNESLELEATVKVTEWNTGKDPQNAIDGKVEFENIVLLFLLQASGQKYDWIEVDVEQDILLKEYDGLLMEYLNENRNKIQFEEVEEEYEHED